MHLGDTSRIHATIQSFWCECLYIICMKIVTKGGAEKISAHMWVSLANMHWAKTHSSRFIREDCLQNKG